MAFILFMFIIFPCHCAVYMYKIMILQKPHSQYPPNFTLILLLKFMRRNKKYYLDNLSFGAVDRSDQTKLCVRHFCGHTHAHRWIQYTVESVKEQRRHKSSWCYMGWCVVKPELVIIINQLVIYRQMLAFSVCVSWSRHYEFVEFLESTYWNSWSGHREFIESTLWSLWNS